MRIIAFIIDHHVSDKILRHLERKGDTQTERGPPASAGLEDVS
jgi:hypothetical protein